MSDICVVLCTYNGEKFLAKMLNSLCAQTLKPKIIIALDDCSKDSTVEILESYKQKLPLKIFPEKINEGHCKAFEKALKHAKKFVAENDFIALADQDDIWLPQKLELLKNKIGNKSLAFGDAEVINSKDEIIHPSWRAHDFIQREISIKSQIAGINNVTGCLSLFSAKLLDDILPIPNGVTVHDRWIAMLAQKRNGICAIDEKIVQYRLHENNAVGGVKAPPMSQTLAIQKKWISCLIAEKDRLKFSIEELQFAKKLLHLTKIRETHFFVPHFIFWIIANQNFLFLPSNKITRIKRILFTAIGLPLAKIIWRKS